MANSGLARYAVKSASLTFNSSTYELDTIPVMKGESKPATEVTALTDVVKKFIAGALKEGKEFNATLFQTGSDLTVDTAPAAASVAITLENGVDTDVTVSLSWNRLIIVDVAPPDIQASSDRKATYTVTFRPSGE